MPKQNDAERSNANTGNTRRGIVRHSTLWLTPALLSQFAFTEWTPIITCAILGSSPFVRTQSLAM